MPANGPGNRQPRAAATDVACCRMARSPSAQGVRIMNSPIRNVSDTALWVAIYRAMESERPDALFNDPYARRLGGERGEAIARTMPEGHWPIVVRTAVMDEI